MKLTPKEVYQRMQELRNIKKLHLAQKVRIELLEDAMRLLKEQNRLLTEKNTLLLKTIEDYALRIEELSIMVFGKKKKQEKYEDDDKNPPTPRTAESYKRPLPGEGEVTNRKSHPLNTCTHCKGALSKRTTVTYYEEDIPLPQKKTVIKHTTEKGYCAACKKWSSGTPIPSASVTFGTHVQAYVVYLSVMARLSFAQIRQLLYDTYTFSISDGEIAKILTRQAVAYRPEYEQLKEELREEQVLHLDETGWKLLKDGSTSYAWSMSTPSGKEVFLVGESRGKGNVETLLGSDYKGVVVSDDYGAYKKLPRHQLCWAHVLRKFRDLAQSGEVSAEDKAYYVKQYQVLASLYQSVRDHRDLSFLDEYTQRLKDFARIVMHDGKKARTLKTTLLQNIPQYLTCLADILIPLTNNQAERSLRHLVLKRKISFGSYSKRTAENLAVLLSVFMSRKHHNPSGWFGVVLEGV